MDFLDHLPKTEGVQKELIKLSGNVDILEGIRNRIYNHTFQSWLDLGLIKKDLVQVGEQIIQQYFPEKRATEANLDIGNVVNNYIHQVLHDEIILVIRQQYFEKDLNFYKSSKFCCKNDVSPKQLGSTFYNFVPKAAVVELSLNLNSQCTPLEKLRCLCTVYDLIFVEMKSALISVISKSSENERNALPIVNNEDVLPVLMTVILKSKIFYFPSDLFYIKFFGSTFLETNEIIRKIFKTYEEALDKILKLRTTVGWIDKTKYEKLSPAFLNVPETISFIEDARIQDNNNVINMNFDHMDTELMRNEEIKRIASQITAATTESINQYSEVPNSGSSEKKN